VLPKEFQDEILLHAALEPRATRNNGVRQRQAGRNVLSPAETHAHHFASVVQNFVSELPMNAHVIASALESKGVVDRHQNHGSMVVLDAGD
jgi:hypothetical protein